MDPQRDFNRHLEQFEGLEVHPQGNWSSLLHQVRRLDCSQSAIVGIVIIATIDAYKGMSTTAAIVYACAIACVGIAGLLRRDRAGG